MALKGRGSEQLKISNARNFLYSFRSDDVGLSVEATEAIWKMKKKGKLEDMRLTTYKKPILLYKSKTNKLGGNVRYSTRRRSDDKDKLVMFLF